MKKKLNFFKTIIKLIIIVRKLNIITDKAINLEKISLKNEQIELS